MRKLTTLTGKNLPRDQQMTDNARMILKIMSSNIIGNDVVPPHTMPWLGELNRLGFVELVGGRVWVITKAGRAELNR